MDQCQWGIKRLRDLGEGERAQATGPVQARATAVAMVRNAWTNITSRIHCRQEVQADLVSIQAAQAIASLEAFFNAPAPFSDLGLQMQKSRRGE